MTARTEQITQDEKRKGKESPQAESSLSSVWAAAVSKYRQTFRNSSIPSSYSEYHHFGLINLVGGSVILLTSYLGGGPVHMLTHGSSLFVIIFGFLFCDYFEWSTHRYRLHDPVKHTRHSHTHHRFFTEKVMVFDSFRDVHAILFPFQAPFFLSVLILVLSIVPMIFFGFQTAMAFACTLACYYVSYEWMHLSYHSPPTSFLGSLPGVAFLRRHHQIHHSQALMGKYNFNITWPICDYLFGTTYKGPVSSDGVPLLDKPTSTPQLDDSNSPVESKPLTANSNGDESKDDVDEIELDEAPPAIGSYTYHALRVYEFFHPSLQLLKDVAPGGLLTLVAFMIGLMVFKTWLTLLIFIVFFMVVILPYLLPKVSLPSYDPLLMLETDEKLFKDTTALVNQADPLSPESPPSTSKVDLVKGSDKALSEGKSPPPTQFQTESKARIEALTEKKFPSSTASASYTHFVSLSQPNRVFASIRQLNLTPLIRIEFDRDAKFPFALTRKSSHLRPDLSHLRGSKHVVVNIVCGPRLMLRVAKYVVGASTLRPVGRFGGHQIIRLLLTEQRYNFIIAEKPPRMILSHIGEGEVGGLYAKHALLCELGEALFAGELWKDKQGEIHFNNASGTYRPKEENLKYVRTYLQEALNLPVHQHDRAEKEKKKEQGNDHSANH